jgi:hypothetical protein
MDFDNIMQIIITSVVLPLLAWGVSKAIEYGNSKIKFVNNANIQNLLLSASDELERAVQLAVTEVGVTYVDALKLEGKLTKEQISTANDLALTKTKKIMSDSGIAVLEKAKVDIEAFVKALIEENLKFDKGE